ncbi:TetR family transcriptional regulator [Pelagibius litoralis]|uniref:TetR family transcriptional regulator n=1 Tax=Pelagibius litoralis TaxID=374515 RepID=A0A967EWW0_9PROT|nr:TetR-like C-terminal domain-containing protein [Pelagibius litoralis]NIA68643.1 TetR family transcriptional regulator [Pelagibius litoralis]
MERNQSDAKTRRNLSGAALKRPAVTKALTRALFEEWAQTGYSALRLERVAARAGAGKAAIYRRWSSKHEFVSQAVASIAVDITDMDDEGTLEADILAFLKSLRRVLRHPIAGRILPDLFAECARSDELVPLLDRIASARRDRGLEIVDRAISRGELPAELDRELALDLIPAPLYWRMISTRRRASMSDLERQAKVISAALRTARMGE